MYTLLADIVVLLHFAFIVFVVAGGIFVIFVNKVAWVHIPALLWGTAIEFSGWICPLTPLENFLRSKGAGETYSGDFIAHYLLPIIYPAGLTRDTQWVLGALLVTGNILIYALVWHRWRRAHTQSGD